ncbi:MAG TPA: UDP-N-acetylmuramoyl-tripeptide--D-alanyl-D-alanine ligase [Gammaproteobacteria bacterium]|nr:UDP-N-acetylmuramoyl-tripeptide--D-alanyl-D-alanine ligase [Gammaproteobacteria bacterium]
MIRMQLSEAARAIEAQLSSQDGWFEGVSTDTRSISRGELFCALKGPNFDGHEHCSEAESAGAAGVIIQRATATNLSTLTTDDTRRALGCLASAWRRRFDIPVVGVTGSNGKTTVKEMIGSILRTNASVLTTKGNLNNDIGVPKTLFQLNAEHEYAVIEMGASHLGEISWLSEMSQPSVGVITLCAPAHLEGFGSLDSVAEAKGELYTGLAAGGTAVINADDPYSTYWTNIAVGHSIVTFGINQFADVMAENVVTCGIGSGMNFGLRFPSQCIDVELPFDGIHNVSNALAAAAAAYALDVPPAGIKLGLERAKRVRGRLCVLDGVSGSRIVDDTYNANPTSLAAALDMITSEPGQKWLVLGDMRELGPGAEEIHLDTGSKIREAGIDRLFTFGKLAEIAGKSFGGNTESYRDIFSLIDSLIAGLTPEVTVLVKGSRSMHMERIIDGLTGDKRSC